MKKEKKPFIAYSVEFVEYEDLKKSAQYFGVSIAQLARGYLRFALKNAVSPQTAVRIGRMPSNEA